MIVCLTDGRANVSLARSNRDPEAMAEDAPKPTQDEIQEEILNTCKRIGANGFSTLIIDTENQFVSTGFAKEIAKAAGGNYYYLPNQDANSISAAVGQAMADAQ